MLNGSLSSFGQRPGSWGVKHGSIQHPKRLSEMSGSAGANATGYVAPRPIALGPHAYVEGKYGQYSNAAKSQISQLSGFNSLSTGLQRRNSMQPLTGGSPAAATQSTQPQSTQHHFSFNTGVHTPWPKGKRPEVATSQVNGAGSSSTNLKANHARRVYGGLGRATLSVAGSGLSPYQAYVASKLPSRSKSTMSKPSTGKPPIDKATADSQVTSASHQNQRKTSQQLSGPQVVRFTGTVAEGASTPRPLVQPQEHADAPVPALPDSRLAYWTPYEVDPEILKVHPANDTNAEVQVAPSVGYCCFRVQASMLEIMGVLLIHAPGQPDDLLGDTPQLSELILKIPLPASSTHAELTRAYAQLHEQAVEQPISLLRDLVFGIFEPSGHVLELQVSDDTKAGAHPEAPRLIFRLSRLEHAYAPEKDTYQAEHAKDISEHIRVARFYVAWLLP